MLRSPRRAHASFSAVHKTYLYQPDLNKPRTVIFCGLLPILRACFFADYDFEKARELAGPIPAHLRKKTGLARPWHGRARGDLGHKQLQVAVNAGPEAVDCLFVGSGRLSGADDMLASLADKHLRPVTSEFIDYYEDLGLATSIDMVCVTDSRNRHGANRLALIEVKFGGDNDFLDSTGPLLSPPALLAKYNNSPRTQAWLQLAFCRQMVVDHYPQVPLGPCYVAQVEHEATNYWLLEQPFIDAGPQIRDAVLQRRSEERMAQAEARLAKRKK
jgi:hypothetical protein